MKKIGLLICLISMGMLVGCAGYPYAPGWIFTEYQIPGSSPDDSSGLVPGSKIGTSEVECYLGWIATGDASIAAAAKNGGIRSVKTVDVDFKNILGLYSKTITTVTGD